MRVGTAHFAERVHRVLLLIDLEHAGHAADGHTHQLTQRVVHTLAVSEQLWMRCLIGTLRLPMVKYNLKHYVPRLSQRGPPRDALLQCAGGESSTSNKCNAMQTIARWMDAYRQGLAHIDWISQHKMECDTEIMLWSIFK